jgi:GGDEF domain-containing protein
VPPDTDTEGAGLHASGRRGAEERRRLPDPTLPYPTLSLGIAVYPDNASDVDDLVRIADAAMYRAKAAGGNTWRAGDAEIAPAVLPAVDVA